MDILKRLLYVIPCRFVLVFSFFILPILSFGQAFYTVDNTLQLSGVENVYSNKQEKLEPVLFVTANTIMTKSEGTTFFVNGTIQKGDIFVTLNDFLHFPTNPPKDKKYKAIPATKVITAAVAKSTFQTALPTLPLKNSPSQQELFCVSFAVVATPSIPVLKQKDHKPFHLQLLGSKLLQRVYKASCYAVFVTSYATMAYGKHVTLFSSRPPPKSRIA